MKHPFSPSALDMKKCNACQRESIDHTDRATCEVCGNSGDCEIYQNNILMCPTCWKTEVDRMSPEEQVKWIKDNLINARRVENTQIKIQTDIFNAKIESIQKIKEEINQNELIPLKDKHFTLARVLDERYQHLTSVLTSARESIRDAENEQRAIQTTYNELAKRLRAEDKEAIRLKDVTYQPKAAPTKKPKKITTKKFDKDEIRKLAKESGLNEAMIQMTVVARGCTGVEAVRIIKETLGK